MSEGEVTVLVIDDDPVIVKLLQVNFEMEGFAVRIATNGQEGLDSARAEPPDVIISDVMMPELNGIELVEALKADDATSTIPIILLSAKAQTTDVRDGLDAGADDYITKPFEPLELVERVNRALARARQHAPRCAP